MAGEDFSRRKGDAMQVSGSYTAIGSIIEVQPAQRLRPPAARSAGSSGDTISISEEALAAYRNSLQKVETEPTSGVQHETQLTRWFNQWHSGANFSVVGGGEVNGSRGTLLPENAALKASLEKEVDRQLQAANYRPGEVASPELLNKLRPLQQKLNTISALGATTVLDEDTLNTAAKFLQALEDAWNEGESAKPSLGDRFLSAISSWKRQPEDASALREKARALRDDAIQPAREQENEAAGRFRKQFDSWRGTGIFGENEGAPSEAAAVTPDAAQSAAAESDSKKASELERKIKDLSTQLEAVLASSMPEMEKNAMSSRISKEIEELQSQLTAYKQTQTSASEA